MKTQFWCSVSTNVLIAIVKKQLHFDASLYTLLWPETTAGNDVLLCHNLEHENDGMMRNFNIA